LIFYFTYHGLNGPIQLTDPQGQDPSGPVFVQACINAGYPANDDFNGAVREGCGNHVFNINAQGIRDNSVNAYLAPALKRSNLQLILNSMVVQILFDSSKKATGVQFVRNNVTHIASARKEIIICAGTINTSKLLLLSGIGPSAHLLSKGITVISDLPVGHRIRVHAGATVIYQYPQAQFQSIYAITTPSEQYAQFGTGPLAASGFFGFAFVKSNNSLPEANLLLGVIANTNPRQISLFLSLHQPYPNNNGVINLTSSNPNDPPFVFLNLWEDEYNVDAVVSGIKIGRTLMNTPPAPTLFGAEIQPGPLYVTDDELRAYVRTQASAPKSHLWGGAPLGNYGDPTAVLDPRARVKGVTGLRVADLSIVPGICGGHPNANVVMFGERISYFILQDNP
jgi:choline dehydrogenase